MSAETTYKNVSSIRVNGTSWPKVDELEVPHENIPLASDHLDSLCRFVVRSKKNDTTESPQLVQISPIEKRTFALRFGPTEKIIFEDQYGNLFGCLDIKGNDSRDIKAETIAHAPSGFRFLGIQESDSILRGMTSSEYLRSQQIDTEIQLKIIRPDQIPFKGTLLNQDQLKSEILKRALKEAASPKRQKHPVKVDNIPDLCLGMEGMDFVLTIRGKQINERLIDLHFATPETFQQMINNAFWFYNYRGQWVDRKYQKSGNEDLSPFKPLDSQNPKDIGNFFDTILPIHIGQNYGLLHDAGVVHVHPHLQNISLLGGIKDTDSIKGEPLGLGDDPITEEEVITDMQRLLYGYWFNFVGQGLIPFAYDLHQKQLIPNVHESLFPSMLERNLLVGYFMQRKWHKDWLGHVDKIHRIIDHYNRSPYSMISNFILRDLVETGQWTHSNKLESVDEVAEELFSQDKPLWKKLTKSKKLDYQLFRRYLYFQTSKNGKDIFRNRAYTKSPDSFDSVKESHGEINSQALLSLVGVDSMVDFPLLLLEKVFKDKSPENEKEIAQQYIQGLIS